MSEIFDFSKDRLTETIKRIEQISNDISFDNLTLPKFVWAEEIILEVEKELITLFSKMDLASSEPFTRMCALRYGYPEVEFYFLLRSNMRSLLDILNYIAEEKNEEKSNPENFELLSKIKGQFGLKPQTLERARLFRKQDSFNSEDLPAGIEELRKAIFVVSNNLLGNNSNYSRGKELI